AAEHDVVGSDLDIDQRAILPAVLPRAEVAMTRRPGRARLPEMLALFRGPDVGDGHGEEFLLAVAILRASLRVDRKEAAALDFEDPHRQRVRDKQQLVVLVALRALAGFGCGHLVPPFDWRG